MQKLWEELQNHLKEHAPAVIPTLNEPATLDQLAQLEHEVGYPLPNDLTLFLQVHNGQTDSSGLNTLCEEGILLSTDAISETYRMLNEINDSLDSSDWWARKYLPITDCEGDCLAVDLSTGEVVMHVHDSCIEPGIAGSFREWAEAKLSVFRDNKFSADGDYLDYLI